MDKNYQQANSETAIHRLAILTRILESDPEIIDSLPDEDISAELREMGIDPRPPLNLIELVTTGTVREAQSTSDIEGKVTLLYEAAKEEIFEDGMESNFTRGLSTLVEGHGADAIVVLARLTKSGNRNDEIAAETLRWAGRLDDPSSYEARLSLLERSLGDDSARVRDAAAVALASMDDKHALPALRAAIAREKYAELRDDMEQILAQLEGVS
jgi:hypothetical protein